MNIYSFYNARPAPLPFRITLPNGFTRTDPSTFTEDEIASAGFTGPYIEPPYDPATEQLNWVEGAYTITPLPPPIPQPRWVDFSAAVMTDAAVNTMLSAVLQAAPGLYGGLVVGLQQASQGDDRVFLNSWRAALHLGLIQPALIVTVQEMASCHNLPVGFIDALAPAPIA